MKKRQKIMIYYNINFINKYSILLMYVNIEEGQRKGRGRTALGAIEGEVSFCIGTEMMI